ncbi:MAG: acyloxyacyl hydrolase [Rhodospirillales bacterium]|nr:acyloxyacyl hydrolase [Rhodospirillales bacterium]
MASKFGIAIAATVAIVGSIWSVAGHAAGSTYDMRQFARQPHPFTKAQAQPQPPAAAPAPSPRAPAAQPMVVAQRAPAPVQPEFQPQPLYGVLSELRSGLLVHDEGPFSRNKESGFDTNFEVLFASPSFLDVIWSPRPHLGGTINSDGNTSQGYFGLTWGYEFLGNFFAEFSFGSAVHDSEPTEERLDAKQLGCSVLFREGIELGYRFGGQHAVSFHFDHISNGKLCDKNEGLETFGGRYGYRF